MSPQDPTAGGNPKRFYGKYRGLVINNIDPLQIGRVMVQVPDVLGEIPSSWAMPCVPAAGIQAGMLHRSADRLAGLGGVRAGRSRLSHLDRRLLGTGGRCAVFATAPPAIPPGQNIVLQTTGQNMLMLSDAPPTPATGGIVLKSVSGAMIVVNETGIYISNGQGATITLIGPAVPSTKPRCHLDGDD